MFLQKLNIAKYCPLAAVLYLEVATQNTYIKHCCIYDKIKYYYF